MPCLIVLFDTIVLFELMFVLAVRGSCHNRILGTWYCLHKSHRGICFPVDPVIYLMEDGLSILSSLVPGIHDGRYSLNLKCFLP